MTATAFATGNKLLREGKLEEAIASYQQAIEQNPQFAWSYQNLGEALEKAGRLEEAIAAFRQAVAINPQSPWSLYKLGVILSQQGEFQEAVGYLSRALDLKKDVPEFYLGLGSGLVKLGQWSEAVECLDRVIQFSPDSQSLHPTPYSLLPAPYLTEAYFYLAEAKSGQEQWSEAVELYRRSWEVNPGRVDCCIGWAKALGKLGRWSEAVELYRQGLVLSGESGEVWFGLGQALGQLGRWDEAVGEYRRAISLGFAGAEVRHHLGYALGQLGRWEEAVVEYRLVVEINPKSAVVRHQLGYGLMRLGRWREAEIELRKAVELYPGSAVVWQQLGDVLRELGKRDEAVEVDRRALEIEPELVSCKNNQQSNLNGKDQGKSNAETYFSPLNQEEALGIRDFVKADRGIRINIFSEHNQHFQKLSLQNDLINAAIERLNINAKQAKLLVALFSYTWYCGQRQKSFDNSQSAFEDFLEYGINNNLPPGPLYNNSYIQEKAGKFTPLLNWLTLDTVERPVPTPYFDPNYYLGKYGGISKNDGSMGLFDHFVLYGQFEYRVPSKKFEKLVEFTSNARQSLTLASFTQILSLDPEGHWDLLEASSPNYHPWLKYILEPEIINTFFETKRIDGFKQDLEEMLFTSVFFNVRPSVFFIPHFYQEAISDETYADIMPLLPGVSPIMHWLRYGLWKDISGTPIFNAEEYLHLNKDLASWKNPLICHFMANGLQENRQSSRYIKNFHESSLKNLNLKLFDNHPLRKLQYFRVEILLWELQQKENKLKNPEIRRLVNKAGEIEPMIFRPYGLRQVVWPNINHNTTSLVSAAKSLQTSLPKKSFKVVLCIPHCRMSGATKIASFFTHVLVSIFGDAEVLIVRTDLSTFEYPEWFPSSVKQIDLTSYLSDIPKQYHKALLLDILRGVEPKFIFNVNSKLFWDLMLQQGRAISQELNVFAYLFTYDTDARGNIGGYPLQWLEPTFGFHKMLLLDNLNLKETLVQRYALSLKAADKFKVLYTPISDPKVDYSEIIIQRRGSDKPIECVWAGRFDRQKRFDIVIALADAMPDISFLVWGKPVLKDTNYDLSNLPPNIELKGAFKKIDEVSFDSVDFFLFTSDWEGMPTGLLEVAAMGVPIVTSSVGDIRNWFNQEVAYICNDNSLETFQNAIKCLIDSPELTSKKAKRLRKLVLEKWSWLHYESDIRCLLEEGN